MNATDLIANLKIKDIRLSVSGDKLKIDAPKGALTQELVDTIKTHKPELLRVLAPKPTGCAWREDEDGRLIFSDGAMYARTTTGGWVLVKHPTRRMIEPGLFEVDGGARQ